MDESTVIAKSLLDPTVVENAQFSQNHLDYSCKRPGVFDFGGARIPITSSDFNVAMANLIRSAKSWGDWADNELIAYNITISFLPPGEFFPTDPSLDHVDPAILNPPGDANPALSDAAAGYLDYLDLAARATQECFIDDFAAETLELLGLNERRTAVSTRYIIPLTICGEVNCVAQTDVCPVHNPTFVPLVPVKDSPSPTGLTQRLRSSREL